MEQRHFINSWLRRVRGTHIAPPTSRRKMGFAIFLLCPPVTLTVADIKKHKINDNERTKKQKNRRLRQGCCFFVI